jgi:hypothetical protein
MARSRDNLIELQDLLSQVKKEMASANFDTENTIGKAKNDLSSILGISKQISSYEEQIAIHGRDRAKMSHDQLSSLSRELKYRTQQLKESKANLDIQLKTLLSNQRNLRELARTVGLTVDQRNELTRIGNEIVRNTKAEDAFTESIAQAEQQQRKLNKELTKSGVKEGFKKIGDAAAKIPIPLLDSLNPLMLIGKLLAYPVIAAMQLDKELGEAAKSMNQTYIEAGNSRLAIKAMVDASGQLAMNGEHVQKTFLELNKTLGTGVAFENLSSSLQKDIGYMSILENYAGLTAEESNSILRYSLQIGKSAKQTSGTLMAQYKISSLQNKIVVNEKEALKEIAKLSESIKISTAGGAQGLAKALAAAKGLGVSLNDIENSASGLLNFEDSIEKELTAELLTGKQLNLEKARSAALNNDLATVAKEITAQVGNAAEFANMNRIQQEAIAAAVGMTREQLAGALAAQEQTKNISKEALSAEEASYNKLVEKHGVQGAMGILAQQQLDVQTKQASIAEKLEQAMLKQKDALTGPIINALQNIWGRFDSIYQKVKEVFDMFGGWKTVLIALAALVGIQLVSGIVNIVKGLKDAFVATRALFAAKKAEAGVDIVGGSYKMAAGLGPAGIAAVAGLMGAGLGALAMYAMNDGIISPSSGGSGYGDRTLFGPEGAIKFNNKDTIVAGTDLFSKKADDMVSSPAGTVSMGGDSALKEEVRSLREAIMALASRPINVAVNADGKAIVELKGNYPNEDSLATAQNGFQIS